MKLHTYLNFGGNCREAFEFYAEHLGGRIIAMMTFDQMPDRTNMPAGSEKNVLHARMEVGGTLLMGSDAPADRFQPIRSSYLSLALDSVEEAERVYGVLSAGGEIFMKMEETFFAHRFASLRDRFGTLWMLVHEKPMNRA